MAKRSGIIEERAARLEAERKFAQRPHQAIVEAIERLADEVKVFREVLDEIRDDFGWIVKEKQARALNR